MQLLAAIVLFYNHRSGGVPLEIYAYQNNEGRYVKVSIHFFKNQLLHWMLAFDQKPNEIVDFWLHRSIRMGCQRVGICKVAD